MAAVTLIQSLVWKLPYAEVVALKRKKKKKKMEFPEYREALGPKSLTYGFAACGRSNRGRGHLTAQGPTLITC